jgi:hypothetical protein
MATADNIEDLAQLLVTNLAAAEAVPGTFSQAFTPGFRWLVLDRLEDLNAAYVVSILPAAEDRERISRVAFASDWEITAMVQHHVDDDAADVSTVAALAKEIREWIEENAAHLELAGGTQATLKTIQTVLMARQHLKAARVASAGVNLTYRVRG